MGPSARYNERAPMHVKINTFNSCKKGLILEFIMYQTM